jgi:MYXO-CTERM domain-containing protein
MDDAGTDDAGLDDAGLVMDDAGMVAVDAGMAMPRVDAGNRDAGRRDAGARDANGDASMEGTDAGTPGVVGGSCGCRAGGSRSLPTGAWALGLVAIAALARRRRAN